MLKENEILSVNQLSVGFKAGREIVTPIRSVSFTVSRRKTLAMVGESGCGKSVTAHTIMKLLPRNAVMLDGEIEYRKKNGDVVEIQKMKRFSREIRALRGNEISIIFQDPTASLNPLYRVGDQIIEALRQHQKIRKSHALDRACEMLMALGIPDAKQRLNDYPHQLSGGMQQRIIIAMAMICRPDLLIADEPTTALDVTIQAQIMELLNDVQRKFDTSILLITHNMGIVADMANDIVVMYMGQIIESGDADDVFSQPLHPYTQGLLRSVPVPGTKHKGLLESITGSTPDIYDLPKGCAFAPRCEYAFEKCDRQPPVFEVGNEHRVCCWLYAGGAL